MRKLFLYWLSGHTFLPGMLPQWKEDGIWVLGDNAAREFAEAAPLKDNTDWCFAESDPRVGAVWEQIASGTAICSRKITAYCDCANSISGTNYNKLVQSRKVKQKSRSLSYAAGQLKYECWYEPCYVDDMRSSNPEIFISGSGIATKHDMDLSCYVSKSGSKAWAKFESHFPELMALWAEVKDSPNGRLMPAHPLEAFASDCNDMLLAKFTAIKQAQMPAAQFDTPWGTYLAKEIRGIQHLAVDTVRYGTGCTPEQGYAAWQRDHTDTATGHLKGCLKLQHDHLATAIAKLPALDIGAKFDAAETLKAWAAKGITCTCCLNKFFAEVIFGLRELQQHEPVTPTLHGHDYHIYSLEMRPPFGAEIVGTKSRVGSRNLEHLIEAAQILGEDNWRIADFHGRAEVLPAKLASFKERGSRVNGSNLWKLRRLNEVKAAFDAQVHEFGDGCLLQMELSRVDSLTGAREPRFDFTLSGPGRTSYTCPMEPSSAFANTIDPYPYRKERFEEIGHEYVAEWRKKRPEHHQEDFFKDLVDMANMAFKEVREILATEDETQILVPGHAAWNDLAPLALTSLEEALKADAALKIEVVGHAPGCTQSQTFVLYQLERLALHWQDPELVISVGATAAMLKKDGAFCTCKTADWFRNKLASSAPLRQEAA